MDSGIQTIIDYAGYTNILCNEFKAVLPWGAWAAFIFTSCVWTQGLELVAIHTEIARTVFNCFRKKLKTELFLKSC